MRSIATAAILLLKAANHASHSFAPPAAKSASSLSFSAAVARQVTPTRLPTTSSTRARGGVRLSALARDLSSLTVVELRGLLREQGSKVSGRKAELVQRLSSGADDAERPSANIKVEEAPVAARRVMRRRATDIDSQPNDLDLLNLEFDSIFEQNEPEPKTAGRVAPVRPTRSMTTTTAATAATAAPKQTQNVSGVSFSDLGLPEHVLRSLTKMGLTEPTPIQREAIPPALGGKDVMGLAQTGTGKTIAFGVPLVSKLLSRGKNGVVPVEPRGTAALVLAPTRELANQIAEQLRILAEGSPVRTMVVVGGQNIQTQTNKLARGTHILVATPGRLIDLMDRGALTTRNTKFLVLDEADMMMDMGFAPSLKKIVRNISPKRQSMLFSATMNKDMAEMAKIYLRNPKRVEVAGAGKTADKIKQELHYVSKQDKMTKLLALINRHGDPAERTVVFGRTKHGMEKLSKRLIHHGIKAGSIHGNKSQAQRDRAIRDFKSGAMTVLVATDVAARGLDIPDVKHVYNYELPNQPESYVHRIGRTARAGNEGAAIAFCSMEEMDDLAAIQKVVGIEIPVASGNPWSRRDSKHALDRIKKRKQENQKAYRKKSTQRRYR